MAVGGAQRSRSAHWPALEPELQIVDVDQLQRTATHLVRRPQLATLLDLSQNELAPARGGAEPLAFM